MGSRLTQTQRSLIIGTILGDGYLRIVPKRKNAFLEINHSVKQRAYVEWKYNILRSIVKSAPKLRNGNGHRIACRFFTRFLPEITEIHKTFYTNKKKIIPDNLIIDPIGLAVWYMDDGSKSGGSIYFNTQQFSLADQKRLQVLLLNRFSIRSNLNRDKEYFRIRVVSKDAVKLSRLIRKYIPESMQYKLV